MKWRYTVLILSTGLAGAASGFFWLFPNGMMAAVLGISLSLGTIWLGRKERQTGTITQQDALRVGLLSGILAGVAMQSAQRIFTFPRHSDAEIDFFAPRILPVWVPLVMGILYGLVVHWGYFQRRKSSIPLPWALLCIVGGCYLLRAITVATYNFLQDPNDWEGAFLSGLMFPLVGAVPFSLAWTLLAAAFDPAWSPKRLEEVTRVSQIPAEKPNPKTTTES